MDGLENAIRNALARTERPDPAQRERVYASARAALEKSLARQDTADGNVRSAQREKMEQVIAAIEADYAVPDVAVASDPEDVWTVEPETRAGDDQGPIAVPEPDAPELDAPERDAPVRTEAVAAGGEGARVAHDRGGETAVAAERAVPARRRGLLSRLRRKTSAPGLGSQKSASDRSTEAQGRGSKPRRPKRHRGRALNFLFQAVVLVAIIGAGLVWLSASEDGFEDAGQRLAETGMRIFSGAPSNGLSGSGRVGAGQFSGDWTTAFQPGDYEEGGEAIAIGGSVSAELIDDASGEALRLRSVSADEAGEVRIAFDEPALERIDGVRSVIAITVRAAGDQPTQISVRCTLAAVEDCTRRRFDVNYEITDLLFEADFSQGVVRDGALIINSDVTGEGRGIDLFEIRVQPAG